MGDGGGTWVTAETIKVLKGKRVDLLEQSTPDSSLFMSFGVTQACPTSMSLKISTHESMKRC